MPGAACGCRGDGPRYKAISALPDWATAVERTVCVGHDTGAEMNEARLRMTRIPKGAELILNKVSGAPGFWIGNVIVMAGVPSPRSGVKLIFSNFSPNTAGLL